MVDVVGMDMEEVAVMLVQGRGGLLVREIPLNLFFCGGIFLTC